MTNDTDCTTLQSYSYMSEQITKYIGVFLYIICLFGTVLNILTLLQRTYKTRSCTLYLITASACDFAHLNLEPLSNILQYGFNYDWTINSLIYCKTKSYLAYVFTVTSGTLTTSASITQYFLSSDKSTRWYYARRLIGIRCIKFTFIFWFIVSIPILFCSDRFYHIFQKERLICSNPARHIYCYTVQLLYICLFNGFLPPFIMLIFGLLTHRNVHHLGQRTRHKSIRIQRINQQLISMLILQAIKSTIASIPYSIFNCYWLSTISNHKALLLQAKENLIHQFSYLLFWSNYTSFFIYIYSSQIFRHQCMKALKKIICCRSGERERR
ncbi:unnamed protein product [Adineta steineri]|uniref:G-protein coupled receptors family 1 profile domain-containing protein n=1 Tax=Adineta steineri TaxID=433720 RepID=A0A813VA30_9BILA|nr:unnamed protein product [Adineta steineri]CAF0944005.1 unnamed protein product [Adineta steineri]